MLSLTRIRFCGEDEDNDPSAIYEEYLECTKCGDNSHRQCARDADAFDSDVDGSNWRCTICRVQEDDDALDVDDEDDGTPVAQQSGPNMANEPLSSAPGADPNSHKDFGALTLDDDPMDGSNSLRKRRSPELDLPVRETRKRRRPSEAASASAGAERPLSPLKGSHLNDQDDMTFGRPTRLRRARKSEKPLAHIVRSDDYSLVISFNVNKYKLHRIISRKPRKYRFKERAKRKITVAPFLEPEPSHYPPVPTGYNAQFFGVLDREGDDKSKPYGGLLTEVEADTSKTLPQIPDRKRFEEARLKAEEDWKNKMAATNNAPEPTRPSQKMSGPPSKIKCINFGGHEIDTWNAAPYPEEYSRNKILYICEFCLKYMNSDYVAWRHKVGR
jgi:histone acetyltransferase SAS3